MGNTADTPTPEEASAALLDAESSRARLARSIAMPSYLFSSLGTAVALQIATTALGLGDDAGWARGALVAGLVALAAVAGVQLARFRRLNGVWLGGFANRVVFGTGGAAYALSGRLWLRSYRSEPASNARGEPAAWLAALTIAALAGLALLVLER